MISPKGRISCEASEYVLSVSEREIHLAAALKSLLMEIFVLLCFWSFSLITKRVEYNKGAIVALTAIDTHEV